MPPARADDLTVHFYLPSEALQGQDVPCNITWGRLDWLLLELRFPEMLTVHSVFNAKEDRKIRAGSLEVPSLERDGYLGVIFKSSRAAELVKDVKVDLVIVRKDRKPIRMSRTVHLFRPSLEIVNVPHTITFSEAGIPNERIQLRHQGYGTLMVSIDTPKESPLQTSLPGDYRKAIEGFATEFGKSMKELQRKYPESAAFFKLSASLDYSKREEALAKIADYLTDSPLSQDFISDYVDAINTSILKSTDFELIFVRPVVDFIKTAIGKGLLFVTPFLEIEVDETPRNLTLEVSGSDVLGHEIFRAKTERLSVYGAKKQHLQLGSLIDWGASNRGNQN